MRIMGNRLSYGMLITGMILLLSGCKNQEEEAKQLISTKQTAEDTLAAFKQDSASLDQNLSDILDGTGDSAQEDQHEGTDGKEGNSPVVCNEGFVFVSGKTQIAMNAKADAVLNSLGEATSCFEAQNCAIGGVDKTYSYPGFELTTYEAIDGDRINDILLTDDSVKTPEGGYLFMSLREMESIFGTGYLQEQDLYTYEKNGTKLCFVVKENEIISVEYILIQ